MLTFVMFFPEPLVSCNYNFNVFWVVFLQYTVHCVYKLSLKVFTIHDLFMYLLMVSFL